MDTETRIKAVKHHLIDRGLSFRAWCEKAGVPRSVARDIVYGRLDGSRSEKVRRVIEALKAEFGSELFD